MTGPEALMTQERLFLEALQNSTKWQIRRGQLRLSDDSDAIQVNGVHAP
jgi:heat shock protein HslJ